MQGIRTLRAMVESGGGGRRERVAEFPSPPALPQRGREHTRHVILHCAVRSYSHTARKGFEIDLIPGGRCSHFYSISFSFCCLPSCLFCQCLISTSKPLLPNSLALRGAFLEIGAWRERLQKAKMHPQFSLPWLSEPWRRKRGAINLQ